MKKLIIFNNTVCIELPVQMLADKIPFKSKALSKLVPDKPLVAQLSLIPNEHNDIGDGITALLVETDSQYYSTQSVEYVRICKSPNAHVQIDDTNADVTVTFNKLTILDDTGVYLNGKKISCGEHQLNYGDSFWVGTNRFIVHLEYIECLGTKYVSHLNISTIAPEPYEGFPTYTRSPRIIKREPTETIELSPPKPKEERKKGALVKVIVPPLMMMLVTVGGGMLMGRGVFVLIAAAGMLVSVVFSVTTFFSDKKTHREKERKRDESYETYLLSRRKRINELDTAQRESLLYHNLSPYEISREVQSYSSRLYERASNDSDFLTLSLGYSTVPTSYKLGYKEDTDASEKDPLTDEMKELVQSYKNVPEMPTVIDLKKAHLGLVGEKSYVHRQLISILTQLCFFQSYHDIEIIILVEEIDRQKFEWARWYPHCRIKNINITGLVSAENQRDQVLGNVAQAIKQRKQKQEEQKKDSQYLPHYIFIIDNPKLIINHSIMEYLQTPETSLGFSLIYTTHIRANLPENIHTVFMLDGGDHGTLLLNECKLINRSVILPDVNAIDLELMARKLTPIKHSQGISTVIPESVTFFELFNVQRPEEIPILKLWSKNACHKSLAVPLGLRGKDDVVALNLHEKAHGPHGLVAGTTGSGKSEIVQSYILSLAVNFHPHEVGFLLIDYKGGGMANLFNNLPHLLGTITNLDGSESMRALASIKSELARRQRILNDHDVNNINQYTKLFKSGESKLPMPHLFLISDEFAELKKEQPDFMSELVSAARIGRSLGVHLILATQKPSGVVDDQIWSNSKFKLALKVANESDSNEVLKTTDAARITEPGRAYLQVGNNEIYELFQSAWSGAPYCEDVVEHGFDSRVYLINQLGQGELLNEDLSEVNKTEESKLTELDVVVTHVSDIYKGLNATAVEKPWLPPLEHKIVTKAITLGRNVGQIDGYNLNIPLGMVDIPEEQKQMEYTHNFFEDGNLAIFGASGFGKSTVLLNTALTLASQNSPKLLNFFIMDYGNSALVQLRSLPHTADYIGFDDVEKLDKLEKLLIEELKERKHLFATINAINFRMYNEISSVKIPAILLFIDNYDVVKEVSSELEEFLVKLTRDGTGVGIYTIISGSRSNVVRYSVLNNFKNKIAQFMFDVNDITAIVGRCEYKLPEVRGRALVKLKNVHVAQCYLPVEYEDDIAYARLVGEVISDISDNNTAPKATGVRVVADIVSYEDLVSHLKLSDKQAVIGFDTESTDPLYLDLNITCHLIIGGPMTGKTNVLKILLKQFNDKRCFIADSRAEDLNEYEGLQDVTYMSTESQLEEFHRKLLELVDKRENALKTSGQKVRDFIASQPPVVVVIDDGDNFIELCKMKSSDMERLITRAKDVGVPFIVTTLPTKMRGYGGITDILKDNQAGIALGNPNEQSVLPIKAPNRYKPVQDIGFYLKRGDVRQFKLPFII
ncbi:MAG: type VII secretion protein EssC [Oscillospiraceae bacterium]|jgi:S-DNA-T family DNA segregation ATPase FtsK/SpoIIIE|nr:type VII secretion protein EssC [Oscillospiraceae bacterium]